jgi:hypothetical protein
VADLRKAENELGALENEEGGEMLALVNTPQGCEPVKLRDVEEPSAAENEAIVEVRAFSLNRGELRLLASRPEGWPPGQDVSGVVIKAALDGSGPREGERVVGLVDQGGWAQRVAVPTECLAILPKGVGFAEAASLPIAGPTALRTLRVGGLWDDRIFRVLVHPSFYSLFRGPDLLWCLSCLDVKHELPAFSLKVHGGQRTGFKDREGRGHPRGREPRPFVLYYGSTLWVLRLFP